MSKTKLLLGLLIGGALGALPGCQVNRDLTAPVGYLPAGPAKVAQDAHGGWMQAILSSSNQVMSVQGELITIHDDTVYILTYAQMNAIPVPDLQNAKLEVHRQNPVGFALWGLAGGISTLSHGGFLIFSAPLWAIFGTTNTSSVARQPNILLHPGTGLEEFKKFSRFPQGLPEGINLEQLVPKPLNQ
jgi:hypothetical protein